MSTNDSLPDDVDTLRQLLLARNAELAQAQAEAASARAEAANARAEASSAEALITHLRLEIEKKWRRRTPPQYAALSLHAVTNFRP
jgi:transposase